MSQENVELVRRWIWAFEHDPQTFVELAHPHIEWAPFEENHSVFRGIEGARRIRTGWLDTWDEHRIDGEEGVDGGDELVVTMHIVGRGKTSGLQVDERLYPLVKVRDGRISYVFEYEDRAEALEAMR